MNDDLISRQAAIDALDVGAEVLRRVLDEADVVGVERAKYEWGLGLIESCIADVKDLPSVLAWQSLPEPWKGEKMIGQCPYDCNNKNELGYCRSTGCVNPKYQQIVFFTNSNNMFDSPCRNCANNPMNGGSGICFCTLGNPVRY